MSKLMDALSNWGADTEGALARFMEDEELFAVCFSTFMEDTCVANLQTSLQKKDYVAAYESAHALKGVSGNMGLSPIYRATSHVAESLRRKDYRDLDEECSVVIENYASLKALTQSL